MPLLRSSVRRVALVLVLVMALVVPHTATQATGADVPGTPRRISGSMVEGGDVAASDDSGIGRVDVSHDGRWAVFMADREADGRMEVWATELTDPPGQPILVAGRAGNDLGGVSEYWLSPYTNEVVWEFTDDVLGQATLYVTTLGGSSLGGPVAPWISGTDGYSTVMFTDDGSRILFEGRIFSGAVRAWTSPLDVADDWREFDVGALTADDDLFLADSGPVGDLVALEVWHGALPDREKTVWISVTDGNPDPHRVSHVPSPGGGFHTAVIGPGGADVVYLGDPENDGRTRLYTASTGTDDTHRVIGPLPVVDGDVQQFLWLPDGDHVVLKGDVRADNHREVFVVGVTYTVTKPLIDIQQGQSTFDWRLTDDAVIVTGDLVADGRNDLVRLPLDGGPMQHLAIPEPGGGVDHILDITPDGRAVFLGDLFGEPERQVYSVPVDGSTGPVRISDPADGFVFTTTVAPDGSRVAWTGGTGESRLRSGPVDGSSDPVFVDSPEHSDSGIPWNTGGTTGLTWLPDSSGLLYRSDAVVDGQMEAWWMGVPPLAPTGVAASATGDDTVAVTWEPSPIGAPVASWTVRLEPVGGSGSVRQVTAPSSGVEVAGLSPDTAYTVLVSATNAAGSATGDPGAVTTLPADPDEPGGPDGPIGEPGVHRLEGGNRYETAAAVSAATFEPGVEVAYLATGADFPDALAGGPLAVERGAPILLASPSALPEATAAELARLHPASVVALGGPAAVPDTVLGAAADAAGGATTARLAGTNRYATAAAIAQELDVATTVYLATGGDFPDALAAGPVTNGAPILLTGTDTLPDASAQALADLAPDRIVALGGPAVVSDAVLAEASGAAGDAQTDRLSGTNRYETAVAIAGLAQSTDTVFVATGGNFPDALAAAPAAGAVGAAMVLTPSDTLATATRDHLADIGPRRIVVLGGPGALADEVAQALRDHLSGG